MSITPPVNLTARILSKTSVILKWGAATAAGVTSGDIQQGDIISGDIVTTGTINTIAGYDVYRNNVKIASPGNVLTFTDNTIKPKTAYTYFVVANDTGGESAQSNIVTIVIHFKGTSLHERREEEERRRLLVMLRLFQKWGEEEQREMEEQLALAARLANLPGPHKKNVHPLIGLIRADREHREWVEAYNQEIEEYQLLNPWFFGA